MEEWAHLRYSIADTAAILHANADRLREQLASGPEDPVPLQMALAAIEQALDGMNSGLCPQRCADPSVAHPSS